MHVILNPFLAVLDIVLDLYVWALILSVVMSWLVAFNVVNTRNRFVYLVGDFLFRITEPALRRIRKVLPAIGGIDLSPMVLILAIMFLRMTLRELAVGRGF